MSKRWWQSKTIWASILGALTAFGAILTGDLSIVDGVQAIFMALLAIFIRDGMGRPIA